MQKKIMNNSFNLYIVWLYKYEWDKHKVIIVSTIWQKMEKSLVKPVLKPLLKPILNATFKT